MKKLLVLLVLLVLGSVAFVWSWSAPSTPIDTDNREGAAYFGDCEYPFVLDTNSQDLTLLDVSACDATCADISFYLHGKEVIFSYNDGKFDIVYDVNDLTGSAQVFLEAMKDYWPDYIKKEAVERGEIEFIEPVVDIELK